MNDKTKQWHLKSFEELSNRELYGILQLRTEVFVVEQTCIFQDMDGKDYDNCQHVFCEIDGEIIACARIFPAGITFKEPSVGRICTSPAHRGSGLGKELMSRSLEEMDRRFPDEPIRIGAQTYLNEFYKSFGFVNASDLYMEDGIEHVEMVRR